MVKSITQRMKNDTTTVNGNVKNWYSYLFENWKSERRNRRKQVLIAELLYADEKELLALWLADQVTAVIADDKELSNKVLNIAEKRINE